MKRYEINDEDPKQRAKTLRREGIDGAEVGATKILKQLLKEFGEDDPRIPTTSRQVHNWIADVESRFEDQPCDLNEVSPELRSFAWRINLVKIALLLGGVRLTYREIRYVKRALIEFQDPFGETVDLIAQYAVIWELAEREAMGKECTDIETMLAFAPWRDEANSELYLLSVQNEISSNPPLLRLISPAVPYGESVSFPEAMAGAYAQLGLPWFFGLIQEHPDGQSLQLKSRSDDSKVPETIDYWKPKCNWKMLIKARLTDQPIHKEMIDVGSEASND
jgi:hypothetical protein